MQKSLGVDTAIMRLDLFPFATQPESRTSPIMQSKRKVLLALTINKQYFIRGIVRYAREHDWYLVTDMMYTGRVPLGWRGDGILTILGYRKELADFIQSAGVPTVAITLVKDEIPLPRVEGDNVKIGQLAAEHFLERGYRHFAWAPFLNDVMDSERHEGFARRLEKRGFACHILPRAHSLTGNVWQVDWAERRGRLIRELKELPRHAADNALSRMTASGCIRRVGRGLYDTNQNPIVGTVVPCIEQVAKALYLMPIRRPSSQVYGQKNGICIGG